MSTVLITGGAGYIGHNTVQTFQKKNLDVISLDNMSRGNKWAKEGVIFYEGDIGDAGLISKIIKGHQIDTMIHFAAFAYVNESIDSPGRYFENNVNKTLHLIEAAVNAGVKNIIFSSSCAVYGKPISIPISENHPTHPINPYGETKLFIEKVLHWYSMKYSIKYINLRYFNAAGTSFINNFGEYHIPETHLIPLLIKSVLKKNNTFKIFGQDYNTKDGTAVRDFIHIDDLSNAHYLAYEHLVQNYKSNIFNLGTGIGYSILEVHRWLENVVGTKIKYKFYPRRAGDPPTLVANFDKAETILGWIPQYDLGDILKSAYIWESKSLPEILKTAKY